MLAIGETLREVREVKGYSLSELSLKTGLNKSYLSKIENNKRDPSINVLYSICESIGLPLGLFILLSERKEVEGFEDINLMLKEIIREHLSKDL